MIKLSNGTFTFDTKEGSFSHTPDKGLATFNLKAEVDASTGQLISYEISPGALKPKEENKVNPEISKTPTGTKATKVETEKKDEDTGSNS